MSVHRPSDPYRDRGTSRQTSASIGARLANIALVALVIVGVLLCLAAPVLLIPIVGGTILLGIAGRVSLASRGIGRFLWPVLVIVAGVAGALLLFGYDGFLFVWIIVAVFSVFKGIAVGWGALSLLSRVFEVAPLAEPIVLGIISGAMIATLRNWRRWRLNKPGTDSLVSSSLSGDKWARSWLTVETFAVSIVAAYIAVALLELLGVFEVANAEPLGTATALWHIVGGGTGGPPDAPMLLSLLALLLVLIGALIGFGVVVGVCSGASLGAISGFLSWHRMLHGASAALTRDYVLRRHGTRGGWVMTAIMRGCSEGVLSAILTGVLLTALHIARLC